MAACTQVYSPYIQACGHCTSSLGTAQSGQSHPEIVSVGANVVGSNFSAPDVFFLPVALTTASTPEAAGIPAGSTPRSLGSWDAADDGAMAAVVVVLTGFVESVFGVFFVSFFVKVLVPKSDSDQEEGGGERMRWWRWWW